MSNRKHLSKKLRFDVFKRDEFTCQYCGAIPPTVILHVDHIVSVKDGGSNDMDNLLTSCESCNLGKGARPLTDIPASLKDRARDIAEKEEQLAGYNKILLNKASRIEDQAWMVVSALENYSHVESYNRKRFESIKRFVELLPVSVVIEAADATLAKWGSADRDRAFRYFCGICWKRIKGDSYGQN